MLVSKAANGRHVVHVENRDDNSLPGAPDIRMGRTRYSGLYFHDDEVATCWAIEMSVRNAIHSTQKGYTVNLYKDGSVTVMSFQGEHAVSDEVTGNRYQGTWSFISGTGRFEGIEGGGTYASESFENIAYSDVSGTATRR